MDIIVGHQNLDFDCVGSMVAAKKLHPEAKIYLQPTAEGGVLEFLNLYRDHFSFFRYSEYRDQEIDKMIVVDTNKRERLGPYAEFLGKADEIILYDHHPPEQGDIDAAETIVGEAGSLISIMVQKLRDKNLGVTSFEATLFMIGLHQETGNLQFGTATPSDYSAGEFLLGAGADLDLVQNFCNRPLSSEQKELLNEVLAKSEKITINNVPVVISTAERDRYIPEVALIAHKLRDMENANLLILMVRMNQRIQMVVRNRYQNVDGGAIARQFGGGGHKRAASATLAGLTLSEARDALIRFLEERLKPELTAAEVMTTPAHSIREDLKVEKAHQIMLELGHGGLPITDKENRLCGIITRSDIDKAVEHDLTHAPVKGFMTPEVVTISPDTGLQQIQNILTEEQIGRLPVTENGLLVGIVTRTDVVRILHERYSPARVKESSPPYSQQPEPDNVKRLLKEVLEPEQFKLLKEWGRVAEGIGEKLYLVGGSVRDILLEIKPGELDLVVEQDAVNFAEEISRRYDYEYNTHEKFRTARVYMPGSDNIDLATARSEYYSHPAALPRVNIDQASVQQDLRRRDFTINSMAVSLVPEDFGELLDIFGGRQDLEEGVIKIIYAMSFLDDPIRIFRAFRFAARFDFKLARDTRFQLQQALNGHPFAEVSGDRLRDEIDRVFREPSPVKVVKRLFERDVFSNFMPEFKWVEEMELWFKQAHTLLDEEDLKRPEMVYYCLLLRPFPSEKIEQLAERLMFNQRRCRIVNKFKQFEEIRGEVEFASQPSRLYNLLNYIREAEVFVALLASESENIQKKIKTYREEIAPVSRIVDGEDLKEWGVEPGPIMGEMLENIFAYQLDTGTEDKEELKEFFKKEYEFN